MGLPARFLRALRSLRAVPVAVRRRPRTSAAALLVALAVVLGGSAVVLGALQGAGRPSVAAAPTFTYHGTWTLLDLQRHAAAGEVAAITVPSGGEPSELVAKTADGQLVRVPLTVDAGSATAALVGLGHGSLLTSEAWDAVAQTAPLVGDGRMDALRSVVAWLIPITLLIVFFVFLRRVAFRGAMGRGGGAAFTTILPASAAAAPSRRGDGHGAVGETVEGHRARLADVAGCDEAKLELTETIEFLKAPERFRRLGATIPRGVLLYGPPGTGKTLLARAVANEAEVPFIAASAAEFVEKYVGVGSRRVRELFAQARKHGRAVIFVDEFDALGKSRGGPNSHEEREQTLNQLLIELDGFSTTEEVVVIAATNRLDTLDPAVLRPGRFNRKIHVGLPDVAGREAILTVHAAGKPIAPEVDLPGIARKTYGFSGAQLADLLNESAILAARRGAEVIEPTDVHAGWLKVAVGTSRHRSMDERERSIIAAHEVGHAICGRVHGDKRKVEEISLFAHGEALGVTVSSQEDNDLPAESDLRARLVALMGGRAAEELLFHEVTGGAANDFEQANRIAFAMVTRWGMGKDPDATDGGASGRGVLSFFIARQGGSLPSDVQAAATRAARAILDEAYEEACRTLVTNMELLRKLAAYLVEHERVDGDTFDALVEGRIEVPNAGQEWRPAAASPRPWEAIPEFNADRRRSPRPVLVAAVEPTPTPNHTPTPEVASSAAASPAAVSSAVTANRPATPSTLSGGRRAPGRPVLSRRVRRLAADYLGHAQAWLRGSEERHEVR